MKRFLAGLGLLASLGSCVVEAEDFCPEGALTCDGDFVVECIADDWAVVDDCWTYCGGTCVDDAYQSPYCLCEI